MNNLILVLLGAMVVFCFLQVLKARVQVPYSWSGVFGVSCAIVALGILYYAGAIYFGYQGFRKGIASAWTTFGFITFANHIVWEAISGRTDRLTWTNWFAGSISWIAKIGELVYLCFLFGFLSNWWH